jgi:mannose-1-phosphate guanylyltransferase
VRAVVLVGGEGTRLRPLTLSVPKQMLPVAEEPMIERVLGELSRHGVDEAVLSLGYLPDAFARAYPDGVAAGVRLSYAVEPSPLDTAGAIRFAASSTGIDETFVVLNGDVLTDLDIAALVAFHRERRAEGSIGLHPVDDPSSFGVVPTDAVGRVTAFVEKPPPGRAPTNLVNAGAYVLEPTVLDRIAEGRRVSIEREVFPAMAADGTLFALADSSYWLDTGTPEAFLAAQFDLLEGRRTGAGPPARGAREVAPGVWTLGSPRLDGAVRAPSLFGDGALVAPGASVVRSIVGPGCVIGPGARLDGSVVMSAAKVASGATVSDSIVGGRAVLGEGCRVRGVSVVGFDAVVEPGAVLEGARVSA